MRESAAAVGDACAFSLSRESGRATLSDGPSAASLISVSHGIAVTQTFATRPAAQTAPPAGEAVAKLVVAVARHSGSAAC